MSAFSPPDIAIIDYGMGNLYSVQRACERVGARSEITTSPDIVRRARGVILPGVGAFEDAMNSLRRNGLIAPLREAALVGKPFLGICLGMQLLMTESEEFGLHEGLGLLPGRVVRLSPSSESGRLKVPHVGWNRIVRTLRNDPVDVWSDTPLDGLADGTFQYFVHSYRVVPAEAALSIAETCYGDVRFCSAVAKGSLAAVQFHPERSGDAGLQIYRRFADRTLNAPILETAGHAA